MSILTDLIAELESATTIKKTKKQPKYVLVIDGKVIQQRPTNKKDLKKAIAALTCSGKDIVVYKLEGEVSIDVPFSITDKQNEEEK